MFGTLIVNMKIYNTHYHNAKHCAKQRGIEWQFTYDTWIEWWGEDIVNRGPYKGQLVMARYNDTGPYHPDNVRKITCSENTKEAHTHMVFSQETREKIRQRMMGNTLRRSPEAEAKRIASYKATLAKKRLET